MLLLSFAIWVALAIHILADEAVYSPSSDWPGWAGVKNMYILQVFPGDLMVSQELTKPSGDSWTRTSFNIYGPQPRRDAPLGNPEFPKLSASRGAKWPVYLTTKYNSSFVKTYCLAKGASVVDKSIAPKRPDLAGQIQKIFLPRWGSRNASTWQSDDTLFIIYMGVNDCGLLASKGSKITGIFDGIFIKYSGLVDQVSLCISIRALRLPVEAVPSRSPEHIIHERATNG